MKISYLVTCHNEIGTLHNLLIQLYGCIAMERDDGITSHDEIIVLDDFSTDRRTQEILKVSGAGRICTVYPHALDNDYGRHKNFGIQKCKGDFIFQIDGDEGAPEALLGENLHALLNANPDIEAYAVPRINDFRGVTEQHAKQWGWHLSTSPIHKRQIVNWPDHQWRIFKKDYPRISFTRRLHEKIEGYLKYVILPADEEYALYHDKTIEMQIATNKRYNEMFTTEENKGHNPYK